jgi:hypothetical protein
LSVYSQPTEEDKQAALRHLTVDRAEIRRRVEAGLPQGPLTDPGPLLCYLTIDGLDHTDNSRAAIRLRGQIHAAIRSATEDRLTTYHTTDHHHHRHPRS